MEDFSYSTIGSGVFISWSYIQPRLIFPSLMTINNFLRSLEKVNTKERRKGCGFIIWRNSQETVFDEEKYMGD